MLHLGNGASCSAVANGQPIDTSMGLTPLAGLVMGTRCGDIDPGIIFHLTRQGGMSIDEVDGVARSASVTVGAKLGDWQAAATTAETELRRALTHGFTPSEFRNALADHGGGLKIAADMEQASIAFETMLGSGEKAQGFLTELKDFEAKTHFQFPELQTADL